MQTICHVYVSKGSNDLPASKLKGISKLVPQLLKRKLSSQFSQLQKHKATDENALDWSQWVESAVVHQSDLKIPAATVNLQDPYLSFYDYFVPGQFIEIHLGWNTGRGEVGPVFKGLIEKINFSLKSDGKSSVSLICLGDEIALTTGKSAYNSFSSSASSGDGGLMDTTGTEVAIDSPDGVADAPEVASATVNDIQKNLKEIADRAGLQLAPIQGVRMKAESNRNSQEISDSKTDLRRLYEMAEEHYAVWYLVGKTLNFIDLVDFVRGRVPSYTIVFNNGENQGDIATSIFGTMQTESLLSYGNAEDRTLFHPDGRRLQFLAETIEVSDYRSVKDFIPKYATNFNPETGILTVYSDGEPEPRYYRWNAEKVQHGMETDKDKFDNFTKTLGVDAIRGKNRINEIKQYMDEIVPKKEAPTDRNKKDKVERAKAPIDFMGNGLKVTLPFGSWKIKAIDSAEVTGISRYSGVYFISEVEHNWSHDGYKQSVTLQRVFNVGKFLKESGLDTFQLRQPFGF